MSNQDLVRITQTIRDQVSDLGLILTGAAFLVDPETGSVVVSCTFLPPPSLLAGDDVSLSENERAMMDQLEQAFYADKLKDNIAATTDLLGDEKL